MLTTFLPSTGAKNAIFSPSGDIFMSVTTGALIRFSSIEGAPKTVDTQNQEDNKAATILSTVSGLCGKLMNFRFSERLKSTVARTYGSFPD